MQEKIIFREMLSEIKVLADNKENRLTVEEIQEFFSNVHLTEEQLKLVYAYLAGEKIQVVGYENPKSQELEEKETVKAKGYTEEEAMEVYREELEEIVPLTDEEEQRLFELAAIGDALSKSRLIEAYLKIVCEVAKTYQYGVLPLSDLIQEGNIGLMLAFDQLEPLEDLDSYRKTVYEGISQAMEEALSEYQDWKEMDEEMAGRVNHLNEAIQNLERDLEHKVSVEELSVYLEMPEEEIRDILRIAGEELKVEEKQTEER